MREGMEKKLMLDLLKHPAQVFYKDETLVVLIPSTDESFVYHLTGAHGYSNSGPTAIRLRNDDEKYVIQTRKNERFLLRLTETGWKQHSFMFEYTPNNYGDFGIIKRYPSLKNAFEERAKTMGYLPMINDPTEDDIKIALKNSAENIRHVKNLTEAKKRKYIKEFPRTFEYMQQNPALVKYAMENTDITLGEISSTYCSASICKMGIKKNAHDLKYVPNHHKTDDMIMHAIRQDPGVIKDLRHPTMKMYVAAVKAGKNGWEMVPDSLRKKVRKAL